MTVANADGQKLTTRAWRMTVQIADGHRCRPSRSPPAPGVINGDPFQLAHRFGGVGKTPARLTWRNSNVAKRDGHSLIGQIHHVVKHLICALGQTRRRFGKTRQGVSVLSTPFQGEGGEPLEGGL
jgi:hypothetical protein